MKTNHFIKMAACIVSALFLAAACSESGNKRSAGVAAEEEPQRQEYSGPVWPALARLKPGENPLWFELGPEGPLLIESPAAASLAAFTPWPFARFIIDMQVWNDFLAMAVNRDGFLVLGAAADGDSAVLYRVSGGGPWNTHTAESFFVWEDKPAVLLYQNDFFTEASVSSRLQQVYVLDKSSPVPLGASVPALENFPSDGPWEAEVIHRGPGGFWYFRLKEKGKVQGETAYFRTGDLAAKGEKISFGEWMNSSNPENLKNIPAYVAVVFNKAAEGMKRVDELRLISPDMEGPRLYGPAGSLAGTEDPVMMYAFFREKNHLALVIHTNGQGFYSSEKESDVKPLSLPSLPEAFIYTGIAVFGNVLVASWEEQQDANIGAAGLMVIKL